MKKIFITAFALLSGAGIASAQAPTQTELAMMAAKFSEARMANLEALTNYNSNYRVQVFKDNAPQWVDLVNVQITDPNAKPVITQVNHDQLAPQVTGLFSKGEQNDLFNEMNAIVHYALEWIIYYNRLPSDRVLRLFNQAAAQGDHQVAAYNPNLVGVWGTKIRDDSANDKVTLWFDKTNGHPHRLAFVIPVEKSKEGATGETINAIIDYAYLRDYSAFHPDTITVAIPSRQMEIRVKHLLTQKKL